MDQFVNQQQIEYYDLSRPKYTQEIFDDILKSTKSFGSYLDIACGTGQLLIPLSSHFKVSIGLDASPNQIEKAQENVKKVTNGQNIYLFTCNVYDGHNKINTVIPDSKFDLITVGQAFHWFEEDQFLKYVKSLLKDDGVLIIAGYSKEHFDKNEQPDLHKILDKTIKVLTPYFECDLNNNDNAYYKSHPSIKKYFLSEIITKYYTESADVPLINLFNLLSSWSAYINFKKAKREQEKEVETKDPIEDLKYELSQYFNLSLNELHNQKVKYHNFYYTLTIHNA